MIRVTCRTNIDRYKTKTWPHMMHAVPRIGEYVTSVEGEELVVVRVKHPYDAFEHSIEIELHYNEVLLGRDKLRGWWP